MFFLRNSTANDTGALYALWRRSVEATHQFLTPADLETISAIVQEHYFPTTILLLAVDETDAPIAFLGGEGDMIDALFVDPDWFGKGVGRVLLDEALRRAPVMRVDVNEANVGALAFYKHFGFVQVGRSETDGAGMPYPLIHMERRDG